ncbi:MAG: MarR family winged helix-turn-helix transcriptional regulator [Armatimonadota bacterium]
MTDNELLNQTEHIADIFTKIMQKIMTDDLALGASEEVTSSQFQAMKHIAQHGMRTIGNIAEGLSISQPAATMMVDRMVKRGLVERNPGRSDRRQAEIMLTDRAKELLRCAEAERINRLSRILGAMEPQERRQFVESMEKFVSATLKFEDNVNNACLRCGMEHHTDCIVNQTHLELAGKDIERT